MSPPRSLTGDPLTDAVVPAAARLVWAVRVADPDTVDAALSDAITAVGEPGLRALAIVLAAMCPDDRTPSELLAWRANPTEYLRLRSAGVDADTASHLGLCATGKEVA